MFNINSIWSVFKICAFIMLGIIAIAVPPANSAEVSLRWEQPHDERVDGYYIYWGPEGYTPDPDNPDATIEGPATTDYTITGLQPDSNYEVVAKSFDSDTGNTSPFSETVTFSTSGEIDDSPSRNDDSGGGSGGCFIGRLKT
ncbi:MAG: fibronectin type III domain-containing protein [Desulfobacteraceae bacterium]|nr:fibronectin type III domain-containing protein [Desulfobacteraceae bacterium]